MSNHWNPIGGTPMDDMLMGTAMDDVLWGGPGDDELMGGAGDDRLIGGPGGDALDGGPGSDTADYAMSDARVHVDLSEPFDSEAPRPGPIYGGHAQGDTLQSIENIWGSSYSDELIGNHVANMLFGRGGNDKINGGRGDDSIWGGAGADVLTGYHGDDMVFGGDDDDLLEGGDGDDTLEGGMGADVLEGGDGDDILEGGMGADDLDGGDNSPVGVPGDAGDAGDTAAYTMSEEGVTIDLGARGGPSAEGGDATGDTLDDIENVRGSDHDDKLTGDKYPNKLYGNMGEDTLMGGAGNDTIRGGKDDDEIDGGAGHDMIQGDKGDDELTGGDGNDTFILMEGDGDDEITDFEQGKDKIQFGPTTEPLSAADIRDILDTRDDNRDGTYTYDWPDKDASITVDVPLRDTDFGVKAKSDRLTENDDVWPEQFLDLDDPRDLARLRGPNVIHGLDGDDEISGDDGDDNLFGNAGNDRLMGGDDDDTLTGGRGDDNLMGGSGRDMLYGGAGADTLSGNRGNDMLSGGSGSDTFWFGPRDGYDTITDFHQGDIISLGDTPLSMTEIEGVLRTVRVNDEGDYIYDWMDTTIVVNRPLTEDDFEQAAVEDTDIDLADDETNWPDGADNSGHDTVYGNDLANMIDGGPGVDELHGGGGDDTLAGGTDNDWLWGDGGNDTFKIGANEGSDTIVDFRAGDMIMLGDEDDLPTAEEVDGVVDSQVQGERSGYVYTWEGTQFTVWGNRELTSDDFKKAAPEPEPEPTMVSGTWPGADDDNTGDNFLQGGAGNDSILGGLGNDMINGGAGNDTLAGGDDKDTLAGGAGNDSLTGGDDDDYLKGGANDDTLAGDGDDDMLDGGAGNDSLTGGEEDDTLDGGAGYDNLDGGAGNDMVYADADDVSAVDSTTAAGATRTPSVVGGNGDNDTLSFARSTAAINDGEGRTGGSGTVGSYTVDASFEKVIGSNYDDMLTLGAGGGSLMGGAGNDTLTGGTGNDTLDGGAGRDMLTGGTGADVFVWGHGDQVMDFADTDRIDVSALGVEADEIIIEQSGGDAIVKINVDGEVQSMVFVGVDLDPATPPAVLGVSDFIL